MNHQHTDDSLSSAQTDVGMKGVAARVSLRVSEYERQLAGMSDVVKGREQDTLLAAIRAADEEDASVGESAKSLRARPVDQRSNITGVGSLLAPMLGNLNANLNIVAAAPILQNFNENLSLLRVSTPRTLARAQTPRQAAISLGSRNKREEDLRSFADQPDSREQSKDPWQPRVSEHKPSVSQEEAQLAFKEHYKEFETVLGKANDLAQRQAQQHHEIRKHMIGLEQETVEGKKQIEDTVRRFHEERQSLNEKIRLLHDVDEKYKLSIASMMTNFQKTEDASNKKMRDMEAAFKQQVLALDAALTTSHNAEISAMKKELEDLKATSEKQLDEFSQQSKEFRAIEEAANKKMQGMEEVFREQISVLETQVAKLQQPELSESDEACCKLPSALNEAQRAQMSGMGEELEGMREAFEERLHEYHEQGKHVMGDLEERCEGQVAAMQQQMHSIEKLSHNFAQREREGHTLTHSHTYSHTHTQSGLATLQQLPSLESPALVPQELSVSSLSAGAAEGSSSEQRMELYSASTPPLENLSPVPTFVGLEVANTALTGVLTPKVQRKHREQQQQFSTRECAVLRLRAVVEQEGDKEVQQPGPEQPLTLEDYATRLLAECLEHGGVVWESPETECKLIQEGQIEGQMKMERQGQTAGRGEAIKSGEVDGYGLDDRNYDALTQGQKLNMAAKMEKDDEEQEDDCLARWLPQAQARDTILNRIDALPAGAEDASDDATLSSTSECLPSPGQDVAEDHHASIFGTSNNMLASGAVESCAMKARQPPSPTCVEPPEPQGSGATRIPDSNSEYSILRLPKILSPLSVPSLCSAAEMVPEMMREGVALEAFSPGGRKGTDGRCLGSAAPQASLASQQESIASTCPSFTMHSARSPSGSVEQRESDRSGEGKHEAVEERLKKTEDQRMRGEGDEDQRVFSAVGDPPPAPAYHVQSSAQNSQASAFDRWLSPGVSRLVASLGDAGEAFFSARRYSLPVTQRCAITFFLRSFAPNSNSRHATHTHTHTHTHCAHTPIVALNTYAHQQEYQCQRGVPRRAIIVEQRGKCRRGLDFGLVDHFSQLAVAHRLEQGPGEQPELSPIGSTQTRQTKVCDEIGSIGCGIGHQL